MRARLGWMDCVCGKPQSGDSGAPIRHGAAGEMRRHMARSFEAGLTFFMNEAEQPCKTLRAVRSRSAGAHAVTHRGTEASRGQEGAALVVTR
jgi:hypothetical protein